MNSWCNPILIFICDVTPQLPHQSSFSMKLLHFPEVSQAERMKTGGQAVLWESEGSFRSWYSQERLICHPCLQAICDCQKCVCGGAGIMGVWCMLISFFSERGFEAASLLSATCSLYPWDLLFCFSLSPSLSALSLTTKCSPTPGTWWLWWVHMKTCQWRYEVLSSV